MESRVLVTSTLLALSLIGTDLLAQAKPVDTIRFVIVVDGKGCPGINFHVIGTTLGSVSGVNGLATFAIPADLDKIRFNGIDWPVGSLKIYRPVDSIYLDYDRKRATYFFLRKKIRSKRFPNWNSSGYLRE